MKKQAQNGHKAAIETMINSVALALFTLGVQQISKDNLIGFASIIMGAGLEFIKYYGRNKNIW